MVAYDIVSVVLRVNVAYCYSPLPSTFLEIYLEVLKLTVHLTIIF